MGELSEALEEFTQASREHYKKIQEILKDQYCWKCPMRSTSKRTNCNEIDAWIRLTGAFEKGIHQHLILDKKEEEIEFLTSRYLSKIIKKSPQTLRCLGPQKSMIFEGIPETLTIIKHLF